MAALPAFCAVFATSALAETAKFTLTDYDGISVAEGIHMQIAIGDSYEVTAESNDPRQFEYLNLDVRRGTLRAEMDDGSSSPRWVTGDAITIHVTLPSLRRIEAASGAEIMSDAMSGAVVTVASSGGASVQLSALDGSDVSVDVSEGAHVDVGGGHCASLAANVSEGASLDMKNVPCADVTVKARQGASVQVHALAIDATVGSGANVRVFGAPKDTKIKVSGGGVFDLK
jgi:hypothetical protein